MNIDLSKRPTHNRGRRFVQALFNSITFPLISIYSTQVSAYDEKGRVAVRGIGVMNCVKFSILIENKDKTERLKTAIQIIEWVSGYATAINENSPGKMDHYKKIFSKGDDIYNRFIQFCKSSQKETLADFASKTSNETLNN
jgi:hypothetical protein